MSKTPTSSPISSKQPKTLRVRKETVRELNAHELNAVTGGFAQKTSQSQVCNKTTTSLK